MTVVQVFTANSDYEIDKSGKRIRRLYGRNAPTPHQGADGKWSSYETLHWYGDSLLICWGEGRVTRTSEVTMIEGDLMLEDYPGTRHIWTVA